MEGLAHRAQRAAHSVRARERAQGARAIPDVAALLDSPALILCSKQAHCLANAPFFSSVFFLSSTAALLLLAWSTTKRLCCCCMLMEREASSTAVLLRWGTAATAAARRAPRTEVHPLN